MMHCIAKLDEQKSLVGFHLPSFVKFPRVSRERQICRNTTHRAGTAVRTNERRTEDGNGGRTIYGFSPWTKRRSVVVRNVGLRIGLPF